MTKALFCFLLGITLTCGLSAQQALHFVYVDASEPLVNEDFFSDNEISSVLEFVGMNNQAMVYYCDGNSSRLFRGNDAQAQLSDAIYTQVPPQPDTRADRKKIRDYLFNALDGFSGEVHLHFYLTDKQVKDVLAGSNFMPKLLPREMVAVGGSSISRMFVHLYYSDRPSKIDKELVLSNLSFYNNEFAPAIEFQITELN
jgi:hypothetical protein